MLNRSSFLLAGLATVSLVSWSARAQEAAKPRPPNILVILSDDQGYADAGFMGSKDIPTPNLDKLAASGMRCTAGYATHAYCSPSRAGLLTGRHQARFGHEHNPHYGTAGDGLPLSEHLLPEFLAKNGYMTGWIGKWHLGAAPAFQPGTRGFKETFGFLGGGHYYLNWKPNINQEYCLPILQNGKPVEVKEHLTLALGHEASSFIRRHDAEPWFLYLAFNAPHSPDQPTPERLAKFAHIQDPVRRAYVAQVSLLDDAIGETLETLRTSGQSERTLVFFLSDNGGAVFDYDGSAFTWSGASNAPLRAGKGHCYEGGVHVPFVVSWPGTIPAGKEYAQPVSSLDIFATSLACAGVPMPADKPYDGVDLVPFLSGKKEGVPHESLFWRRGEWKMTAVRSGDFKLIRDSRRQDEVYNLASDLGEQKNLVSQNPKQTNHLEDQLDAWLGQMSPALAFTGELGPEKDVWVFPKRNELKK